MAQALNMNEDRFSTWDGAELFYRCWVPEKKPTKRVVILFHRGHEHSARWQDVVEKLDLAETAFYAWDARGHGHSPGERGYAADFGDLVRDMDCFVRHVSQTSGVDYRDIVVLAHSVGSVVASTWVHDYAPPIRALILGSPALRVRLYVPFAVPGLRLLQAIRGKFFISSYVKGRLLTHDPDKQKSYDADPLITPNIAVNILLGLYDAGTRLIADAGAIRLPVLILSSGADFVVKQSAQRDFYNGLANPRKEMQTFPGFLHDTFNELDSDVPIRKARMFIEDAFSRPPFNEDLTDADQDGHTKREYDRLRSPLPFFHPKALNYALTRFAMRTVGKISEGIRTGWETGFDSGSMLDYVYRNEARGITPLGRLMDRLYLDSAGWRGIRTRKANIEMMLRRAIEEIHAAGKAPHIVDIATGHGRYVLDAIKENVGKSPTATLRDYSSVNVEAGSKLAERLGLPNVRYVEGDAFDRESLSTLNPAPDIAIVSGLYELFPENDGVRNSLAGLADACAPGALLIYTNQPWHPQLEFIARVLSSHRGGQNWVMRRRSQAEMDQLVAAAGFEKQDQLIDGDGIFSVAIARRRR